MNIKKFLSKKMLFGGLMAVRATKQATDTIVATADEIIHYEAAQNAEVSKKAYQDRISASTDTSPGNRSYRRGLNKPIVG